jgi:phenylalanyl-tRNA synthetase beta subunit
VLDAYQSEAMSLRGERSISFRLIFQGQERTLTSEEVETKVNEVVVGIEDKFSTRLN